MGRYGGVWGDMGRCIERSREIWGDLAHPPPERAATAELVRRPNRRLVPIHRCRCEETRSPHRSLSGGRCGGSHASTTPSTKKPRKRNSAAQKRNTAREAAIHEADLLTRRRQESHAPPSRCPTGAPQAERDAPSANGIASPASALSGSPDESTTTRSIWADLGRSG